MHHETSAAQAVIREILEEAKKKGLKKISKASVTIGEARALDKEYFTRAFEVSSKGTPLEGIELGINISPLKARCAKCLKEFRSPSLTCPSCKSGEIEIVSGQELLVSQVE
jgi:hydrogenase nickel incorporation protein HypA/HybF